MLGDGADGVGVQVAGKAHLEGDVARDDVREQGGVLTQPRAVADAPGAAVVQRLMDRVRPVSLAGMAGARRPVPRPVRPPRPPIARPPAPPPAREAAPPA